MIAGSPGLALAVDALVVVAHVERRRLGGEAATLGRVKQGGDVVRLVTTRSFDPPSDGEVGLSAYGGMDSIPVEPTALARAHRRAVSPARVRVGVPLALRAVLREIALPIRVGGQVGSVDGEVAPEFGLLGAEPVEYAGDARVERESVYRRPAEAPRGGAPCIGSRLRLLQNSSDRS